MTVHTSTLHSPPTFLGCWGGPLWRPPLGRAPGILEIQVYTVPLGGPPVPVRVHAPHRPGREHSGTEPGALPSLCHNRDRRQAIGPGQPVPAGESVNVALGGQHAGQDSAGGRGRGVPTHGEGPQGGRAPQQQPAPRIPGACRPKAHGAQSWHSGVTRVAPSPGGQEGLAGNCGHSIRASHLI